MPEQNQQTKNALIAIDSIKRMGILDSITDIGNAIDYQKQNISQLKSGSRNMPLKHINRLIAEFHINPEFIWKNNLPIFDTKGPYEKYNNVVDPSNQDILARLDAIEKNQKRILELLEVVAAK